MATIACLGWGSLIWDDSRPFPIAGNWQLGGPLLPLEFARRSINGCLTLVIHERAPPSPTRWARLPAATLDEAAEALRRREGAWPEGIGHWPGANSYLFAPLIGEWAQSKQLHGVVWTALPPKWNRENGRAPTPEEALRYLETLTGETRDKAEEYIRRAPREVRTPYREIFEEKLGWHPVPAESG